MDLEDQRNLDETLRKKADLVNGKVPSTQLPTGGSGDMLKSTYDPDADGVIAKPQLDASLANTSGTNTGDQTLAGLGGIAHSLATSVNDFLIAPGAGTFVKKTLAETLTILGKAVASGLAPLDVNSKVPTVNLGGAGANGSNFLRGDQTWAVPAGGGGINTLKKTADQIINAGAGVFTDITDLTFPVVNGVDYAFHFYITFQSALTTTGWKVGVNCPAGVLDFWAQSDVIANGAAGVATHTERHNTVRDDMTLLTATITQAADLAVRIEGRYKCTANGTFSARFANELASNTNIVVQKGSWGWYF